MPADDRCQEGLCHLIGTADFLFLSCHLLVLLLSHFKDRFVAPTRVPNLQPVVSALLVAFAQAAETKDNYGKLPLHVAALYQASVEVVSALLVSFPQAAETKDKDGGLPLHLLRRKEAGTRRGGVGAARRLPASGGDEGQQRQASLHFAVMVKAPFE